MSNLHLLNYLSMWSVEEFAKYNWEKETLEDVTRHCLFPPPVFSLVECPFDYKYYQNPALIKVLVKHKDKVE
jgi:hypothetical protein